MDNTDRDKRDKTAKAAIADSATRTVAEVARQLGVSARTVRRWIAAGQLAAERVRGARGLELRIPAAAVATARLLAPPAAVKPDSAVKADKPDKPDSAAMVVRLARERDGARLAAKLHAVERSRLESEVRWLKARVENLEALAAELAPKPRPRRWWEIFR
jgi:excisionase family DNA binding protein